MPLWYLFFLLKIQKIIVVWLSKNREETDVQSNLRK